MIRVENLWKCFGSLWALRGLTFEVRAGSVFGLIGPNGAGKTTALRILATSLSPTRGDATVLGKSVVTDPVEIRPSIGFMPERFSLYDDLRVFEYVDFFAGAYHVKRLDRERVVDEVLELTDMREKRDELLSSLSKGMRQRVLLAKCLVHDPRVLILDEPASGLDPRARIELRSVLRTLGSMGKCIVVSSHILAELGEMCDAIGIMESGRMITSGTVDEMESRIRLEARVRLRFRGARDDVRSVLEAEEAVQSFEFEEAAGESSGPGAVDIRIDGGEDERIRLVERCVRSGVGVIDFHQEKTGLEQLFLALSKGGPS